jgi:hypothetical protein
MTDRGRVAIFVLAGAVIGGFAGFLLFTDKGRRARAQLAPHLDELSKEVRNLGELALRVRDAAMQGRRQVETLLGEIVERGDPWGNDARRH